MRAIRVLRKTATTLSANVDGTATGLAYIREDVRPGSIAWSYRTIVSSGLPYYSISLSLNALLTVMIIYRLVARNGKDRNTMENLTRTIGLYKAVVTMFVESLFLYLIAGLLFIGTWNAKNFLANFFSQMLVAIQVRAFPKYCNLGTFLFDCSDK